MTRLERILAFLGERSVSVSFTVSTSGPPQAADGPQMGCGAIGTITEPEEFWEPDRWVEPPFGFAPPRCLP